LAKGDCDIIMKSLRYYIDLVEEEGFTFSPEQEKFLGNADRQDPHILKRMPGPKPPISYFKNPEDQAIAKQLNFGQQNVNAVTQAFGGSPDKPETFPSGTHSVRPADPTPAATTDARPVAPPVAPPPAITNAVAPNTIKPITPTNTTSGPTEKNEFELQRDGEAGTGVRPEVPPADKKKVLAPVDEKLKLIQEKLKAMGYDLGPTGVDGRMGKYTRQAIDDFNNSKPPGKTTPTATTTSRKTTPAADGNAARIEVLKKQAAEQRKAGDYKGANETDKAIVKLSGIPGDNPAAPVVTPTAAPEKKPEQDQEREEALARLEKRAGLKENFDKLTPVEQIQKIRHMVDLTERDALGWNTEPGPIMNTDVRALGPAAANAGSSTAGKVAKTALGTAWKKIAPGAGLAFGAQDAYNRGKEGDWIGAGLAGASAIASLLPGPGTLAALGLDAVNIGRDVAAGKYNDPKDPVSPQERAQIEQDWKTLEPYYTDPALFKSLSAKDQARLTALKQRAADVAAAAK